MVFQICSFAINLFFSTNQLVIHKKDIVSERAESEKNTYFIKKEERVKAYFI